MVVTYETFFFDENRNVVPKEKAVEAVVRELDEDGNLIRETWANVQGYNGGKESEGKK